MADSTIVNLIHLDPCLVILLLSPIRCVVPLSLFDGVIPAYPTNFQGVENRRMSTISDTIVNAAETGSGKRGAS